MIRRRPRRVTGALTVLLAVLTGLALAVLMPVSAFAASAPSVDGQSASNTTPFAASLEGQVNPQGETTTSCVFEYGTTTAYGESVNCEPEVLEGEGDQGVSHRIEGLAHATTYHFRVKVANATGTTEGADGEFTTAALEAPLVEGESASQITSEGATLQAQVNPNYQEATYAFEYARNEAMTGATTVNPPEGTEPLPAGFEDHAVAVTVSEGLSPGMTYYYRLAATNATGTTRGAVQSFTTIGAPHALVSGEAVKVTRTTAILQGGSVDPDGATTSWYYRYIDQAGYEAGLVEDPQDPYLHGAISLPLGSLAAAHEAQALPGTPLFELKAGSTYHFALVASNSSGIVIGPDETFTTAAPTPPLAVTGAAEGVSGLSATLTGSVETQGLPTQAYFEFGTVPSGGTMLPVSLGPGTPAPAALVFTATLTPGTTYYYRFIAVGPDGTSVGAERSFTTGSLPGTSTVAPVQFVLFPAFVAAELAAGTPGTSRSTTPRPPTKAQKLAQALRACNKKPKRQRAACRHQAKKRYA
jgi:hypothetical protein